MRPITLAALALLFAGSPAVAEDAPGPNRPDEPAAPRLSLGRAADFLDAASQSWTRNRKCTTCHTNVPYLVARPLLGDSPAHREVRAFFEDRAANWETNRPRWDAEVVVTAYALAGNDAHAAGKLHPMTRKALDRMWALQRADGAWDWLKCDWPPMEHDDYYGATLAALAAGLAPEGYAKTEPAREGIEKLRRYFRDTPAPDLHHRAMLLWASTRIDGLMTDERKREVVRELREKQRADGGWCLPSLGTYTRHDDTPNAPGAPSDGYATGLAVFVLRQAGVPADDPALRKG
ncbi:MAG TPA: hypothetical protein VIL46_16605, partial [Gemmataceae bacterium]